MYSSLQVSEQRVTDAISSAAVTGPHVSHPSSINSPDTVFFLWAYYPALWPFVAALRTCYNTRIVPTNDSLSLCQFGMRRTQFRIPERPRFLPFRAPDTTYSFQSLTYMQAWASSRTKILDSTLFPLCLLQVPFLSISFHNTNLWV